MRTNYEIEIKWENGKTLSIPMYATQYQVNKAFRYLSCALNCSKVERVFVWLCTKDCKVKVNSVGYGRLEKAV